MTNSRMHAWRDEKLIRLVVKKNEQAFKMIYDRYKQPIYNFILRYTGNRELAQDLLQDTFKRLWFKSSLFDKSRGSFKNWFYKLTLNVIRQEMVKKRYTYGHVDIDKHEYIADQTQESNDGVAEKELIIKALNQLTEPQREIIVLKHYQGLQYKEICSITGIPEGTLKARFHTAIKNLKTIVSDLQDIR